MLLAPPLLLGGSCSVAAAPAPKSIVLITLDALRPDHLGCYGYPRNTSPFLDSMAEQGVRFTRAIAASSHTAPTHASLFTSLYPIQHRVLENGQRLRPEFHSLAGVLSAAGYETAAFTSVGFLQGLDSGFDHFVPGDYSDKAYDVLGRAEVWLQERERARPGTPLFLWVHLYDAHQPYLAYDTPYFAELRSRPEEVREEHFEYVVEEHGVPSDFLEALGRTEDAPGSGTPEENLMRIIDNYDAEIRLADGALERFYASVSALGLNRDALWIFASDHGEGLGSHRLLGHDRHLYQEQLRNTLIVHGTGGRVVAGVAEQLVRQVDLFPTILEWADVPLPGGGPAELEGMSLMPVLTTGGEQAPLIPYAFSQRRAPVDAWRNKELYALQTERYKFIFRDNSRNELYDLSTDPEEHVNLVDSLPARSEQMRRIVRRLITSFESTSRVEPLVDGSGHVEELSALGYTTSE